MKTVILMIICASLLWSCYEPSHTSSQTSSHAVSQRIDQGILEQIDMTLDQFIAVDTHILDMTVVRSAGLLINSFDWQWTDTSEDPFYALITQDQSMNRLCDTNAHGVEEVSVGVWSYSIETNLCHWLTIKQEVLRPVLAGDRVKLKVWHFELNAPQRAVAHVGLATDHEVLIVEEEVIPQEGRMLKVDAVFTHDLLVGDWIYFHLDNHGANSWHVLEIKLLLANDLDD
jgi:hypothetical protein